MKQVLAVIALLSLCCPVPGQSASVFAANLKPDIVDDRFRMSRFATNAASDRLSELRRRSEAFASSFRDARANRTRSRGRSNRDDRTRPCTSGCTTRDSSVDTGQNAQTNQAPLQNPNSASPSCDGSYQVEQELLELLNAARSTPRQCGSQFFGAAPSVAWDQRLATAAGGHSQDMATYDFLSHTGSDGLTVGIRAQSAGYQWRAIGENIAVGFNSPQAVLGAWLNSPGHCRNIMNSGFTEIGVASARNDSALYGQCARWWTLVVARPRQ